MSAAGLILAVLLVGCATPGAGSSPGGQGAGSQPFVQPNALKRITLAIGSEPTTLYTKTTPAASGFPGLGELQALVLSGLVVIDNQSAVQAQLAEAVPSAENGLWKVLPDGRMETTWKIRAGSRWHDNTLFTAEDLAFTFKVASDRDLPSFRDPAYDSVETVEAVDPSTVLVRWKQPFIKADRFWGGILLPVPRHLLEQPYAERKDAFTSLPQWFEEFVGTGPFKVREIARGSHMTLDAFDGYSPGRAKIDVIEARFIPDSNTIAANILAGEIGLTLGRTLSLDQGIQIRDRWRDGHMDVGPSNSDRVSGQFINPNPTILADARFRQALLYAMDRQQMIDTFQAGLTTVPHTYLLPKSPEEAQFEPVVVRYDHDPRRATQLIEELGYSRGSDGFFRDASGQRLSVPIRTTATEDIQVKELFAIADYWQRIGVAVDTLLVSQAQNQDRAERANRPGFLVTGGQAHLDILSSFYGKNATLPETNYAGGNQARYINPDYDALYERYLRAVPLGERNQLIGQLLRHITEQLPDYSLTYRMLPVMIANRFVNVTATPFSTEQSWNAHLWDVV